MHGACAMTMEVPGKRGDCLYRWMGMLFIDRPLPLLLCAWYLVDVGSLYRQDQPHQPCLDLTENFRGFFVLRVRRALCLGKIGVQLLVLVLQKKPSTKALAFEIAWIRIRNLDRSPETSAWVISTRPRKVLFLLAFDSARLTKTHSILFFFSSRFCKDRKHPSFPHFIDSYDFGSRRLDCSFGDIQRPWHLLHTLDHSTRKLRISKGRIYTQKKRKEREKAN